VIHFFDASHDAGSPLSPDATSLDFGIDSACNATFGLGLTNRPGGLVATDTEEWYLNTDNSLATGAQTDYPGADYHLVRKPYSVAIFQYDVASASFDLPVAGALPAGQWGVTIDLSRFLPSGAVSMTVAASASASDAMGMRSADQVPDVGRPPFVITTTLNQPTAAPVALALPRSYTIPTTRNHTLAKVKKRLLAAGCTIGKITRRANAADKGTVIRTSPKAGTVVAVGTRVAIVVSAGSGAPSP